MLAGTNDALAGEEFNAGALTLVLLHCLSILVDGCNESEVATPSVILFCLVGPVTIVAPVTIHARQQVEIWEAEVAHTSLW